MKLFDENGWPNFSRKDGILSTGANFIFIWGGRGTGKTYTMQKTMLEEGREWLFLRRTNTQLKTIVADPVKTWPWAPINRDMHLNILPFKVSGVNGLYEAGDAMERNEKSGKWKRPEYCPIGLSSVLDLASTNGFNNPGCSVIYLDEYQLTGNDYYRSHEGSGLAGIYESINRNRELNGEEPVTLIAASNACGMANPYFMQWEITDIVEKMIGKGQRWKYLPEKKILLVDLIDSPISKKKSETSLYKSLGGTDYYRMAIENQYAAEEKSNIISRNLREYVPVCQLGRLCIYAHKSEPKFYVSRHKQGTIPVYGTGDFDRKRFKLAYRYIIIAYLERRVEFETYTDEIYFRQYT